MIIRKTEPLLIHWVCKQKQSALHQPQGLTMLEMLTEMDGFLIAVIRWNQKADENVSKKKQKIIIIIE